MGVAKQLRSLPVWLVAQGLLVAVLFVVLCRVFFSGQSEPAALRPPVFHDISALDDGDVEQIDAWLQEQVALAQYPSLSVAIVCDGRVVYRRAFGFEDVEAGRQATPETSYHVASVTKVFTAALAVLLHERGVVNLDKPVVDYLPAGVSISTTPKVGATITLRQLASHTSGLPRDLGTPVQSVEGRYALEPQLLYGQLAKVKLVDDPGTSCAYSNLGIGLLGLALERAAGKPYDELLIELVCAPLQLQHTAIQPTDQHHVARGYSSEVPRRPEEHSYRNRLAASGGLITSAPDLAQFLLSQMEPGVFSREAL
ncbi:MAG: serine hydrolase domain-containing protein, partial [Planctomycetaceae bacterium]